MNFKSFSLVLVPFTRIIVKIISQNFDYKFLKNYLLSLYFPLVFSVLFSSSFSLLLPVFFWCLLKLFTFKNTGQESGVGFFCSCINRFAYFGPFPEWKVCGTYWLAGLWLQRVGRELVLGQQGLQRQVSGTSTHNRGCGFPTLIGWLGSISLAKFCLLLFVLSFLKWVRVQQWGG